MRPTDFEPPLSCKACERLDGDGRCHGCNVAQSRHVLQRFAMKVHGIATYQSDPELWVRELCAAGVVSVVEARVMQSQLKQLFAICNGFAAEVGQAIGTDIANDWYAAGNGHSLNGDTIDDSPFAE